MRCYLSFLLSALVLMGGFGCKPKSQTDNPAGSPPEAHTYAARGIIQAISANHRTLTIKHEKIEGYMGAMTMDFSVKNTNQVGTLAINDEITFNLVVQTDSDWIENLKLQSHHIGEVTNDTVVFHIPDNELKPGERLPDGELVTEDGGKIKISDFRGRALAFTFFFTSCPLPDYCPRMNKNFAEARQLLSANTNANDRWEMLSISFDPGFDKPEILASFATFYRGQDTNHWLFCAAPNETLTVLAPSVGLSVFRDGSGVNHNLRTVVLDPNGKIFQQFDGNEWSPQDLANSILAAVGHTNDFH